MAYDDGAQDTKDFTVPARGRLTVRINADFRDLDAGGAALATKIE